MGSYLDQAIARLKEFEGSVPWMYLDTVGKVTVGVGAMLPDAKAAGTLPFSVGERAATAAEIAAEYARVSGLAKGRTAAFYRKANGPLLSEAAIEERLREVLEGFEGYLREHIHAYEALPDAAKLGLLDMIYNLGPGRLFREYPKLIGAIEQGNWAEAAKASLRHGPSPVRNSWTKQQFLDAAKSVAIKAEAALERAGWRWAPVLLGVGAGLLAVLLATDGAKGPSGARRRLR